MPKDKELLQDELVKSLAEQLDMTEQEILSFIEKSEETDLEKGKMKEPVKAEEPAEDEESEDEESEEDEDEPSDEEKEKAIRSDLEKSIVDSFKKLKAMDRVEKSTDDLFKSMEDKFEDRLEKSITAIKEEYTSSIGELKDTIEELQKSVNLIGNQSQGTKGIRFNAFLEKSNDTSSIVKDGKTYLDIRDRDGISEAMFSVIEKSGDESEIKKSMSADLINYQGSNELSTRAVKSLINNGYYFKQQIQE